MLFFRNPKANVKQSTGFQGGRKATGRLQSQTVTDVSVTVPGVRKQNGFKTNKTNQVRDAREKLNIKAKLGDAREKLNQKAQPTDARQKLLNIRAKKGQVGQGTVDARIMLQAKRQQQGSVSFTRTVSVITFSSRISLPLIQEGQLSFSGERICISTG